MTAQNLLGVIIVAALVLPWVVWWRNWGRLPARVPYARRQSGEALCIRKGYILLFQSLVTLEAVVLVVLLRPFRVLPTEAGAEAVAGRSFTVFICVWVPLLFAALVWFWVHGVLKDRGAGLRVAVLCLLAAAFFGCGFYLFGIPRVGLYMYRPTFEAFGTTDYVLFGMSLTVLALPWVVYSIHWSKIPERVPTSSWKSGERVYIPKQRYAAIQVVIALLLLALQFVGLFDPFPAVTGPKAVFLRHAFELDILGVSLVLSAAIGFAHHSQITGKLSRSFLVLFGVAFFLFLTLSQNFQHVARDISIIR